MILSRKHAAKLAFSALAMCVCLPFARGQSNQKPVELPTPTPVAPRQTFTLESAIVWALERNPEIAAIRERHGIAAAGIVIARTYPFNPTLEAEIRATNGPVSATITNRVSNIYKVLQELEVRKQWMYRRQGAYAALSRTDYEIAYQELLLAGRVMSAFNTVLYRRQKLQILDATISLNERTLQQVNAMFSAGTRTVSAADAIFARSELNKSRALHSAGRSLLVIAVNDLRRQLGEVDLEIDLIGALYPGVGEWDIDTLTGAALSARPDLRAKQAAVSEAQASLNLTNANRYGNPTLGPDYEYDPTRINLIGIQLNLPLPVFNTHRGDIFQRQAELARANLEVRQNEIVVRQDVTTAVERLRSAAVQVRTYERTLTDLETALKDIQALFSQGSTDLVRVIEVERNLISARDGNLDALFELSQARTDLSIALGDPAFSVAP
jgi:cobalt-zinc-cadmium efflux system outer membrane protein